MSEYSKSVLKSVSLGENTDTSITFTENLWGQHDFQGMLFGCDLSEINNAR